MDLLTLNLCGIEQRHSIQRCIFCHYLARRKLQAAPIAYDHDTAAYSKCFKVAFEVNICEHFDDDLDTFVISEIMDIAKVVFIRVIKNGIDPLFLNKLFAIVRTCRSDDSTPGI